MTVGRGGGEVSTATVVGSGALAATNTGAYNAAFGLNALNANTSGTNNQAFGAYALYVNTTGSNNKAFGDSALQSNTTGGSNVAVGQAALTSNTTASNSTAVGYQAGYSNTTGDRHTAIGFQSVKANTTGARNTGIGAYSLSVNQTGNDNVAVGDSALYANTGSSNTAVGQGALYNNTTAVNNTAVGYQAGTSLTTGGASTGANSYFGYYAGRLNTGDLNCYVGYAAGQAATSGSNNTFVGGYNSGGTITTGAKNTILGCYNGNQGGLDIRTASNYVVLSDGDGNPYAHWSNNGTFMTKFNSGAGSYALKYNTSTGQLTYDTSSARYKNNIRDSIYGLSHVMQIRSTQFEYKDDGRSDVGFIAEEMVEVVPEVVAIDKEGRPDAVSYDRLVSVCVKAIQELKTIVDAQAAEIAELKAK
jgi:hypothetical protein